MYVLVLEAMSLNRKKRTAGRATSLDSQVASHLPTQTRWHASRPMTRWRSWRTAFNLVNLGTVLTVLYLRRPNRLVECAVMFRKEPRSDCQFPNHYQLFRQHSISSLSKPLFPLNVQVWESTKATFRNGTSEDLGLEVRFERTTKYQWRSQTWNAMSWFNASQPFGLHSGLVKETD